MPTGSTDVHGRRRIRLGPLVLATCAGAGRALNAVLLDALVSAAIPDPSVPVVPLPLSKWSVCSSGLPAIQRGGTSSFFRAGLRRPRRGRTGRAQHLAGRQLRLHDRLDLFAERRHPRRGRADRHRAQKGVSARMLATRGARRKQFGTLVAPEPGRPNHSHHFNFRLDLDIDGRNNSFMLGDSRRAAWATTA